jgi:hypothetical protein
LGKLKIVVEVCLIVLIVDDDVMMKEKTKRNRRTTYTIEFYATDYIERETEYSDFCIRVFCLLSCCIIIRPRTSPDLKVSGVSTTSPHSETRASEISYPQLIRPNLLNGPRNFDSSP